MILLHLLPELWYKGFHILISIHVQFADEISENGFSACQIEIDDDWTPAYGDMSFDTKKFPDAKKTIQTLTEKGYRVTMWVSNLYQLTMVKLHFILVSVIQLHNN